MLDGHPTLDLNYRNLKRDFEKILNNNEIKFKKINYETINNELIEYKQLIDYKQLRLMVAFIWTKKCLDGRRPAITNEILDFIFKDENLAPPLGGVLDINYRKKERPVALGWLDIMRKKQHF